MTHIVITFPHPLGIPGGAPLDCMQTAQHLKAAGADVTVLPVSRAPSLNLAKPADAELQLGHQQDEKLRDRGIEIVRVPPHPLHSWLDGLQVKKVLKAIMVQKPVDAVLGWHHEVAFSRSLLRSNHVVFGMIAAASYAPGRARGVAHILQDQVARSVPGLTTSSSVACLPPLPRERLFNATFFRRSARWLQRRLLQTVKENLVTAKCLRQADIVFARSSFTAREIVELFHVDQRRVTVSYCGVDPLFVRAQRSCTREVTRFIFYGWLVPQKGIFDLLDALARVAAQGQRSWRLKIAGWGDEDRVRQVAHERGISDQVELLGRLDHQALVRELEWAHIALLPSAAESFGLAVVEAQASGLPVIACEVGAVPEVVEKDVSGWLVPPGRVDLLAEAIVEAIQQPERAYQMGLAGRERVTRLFSWKATAAAMLQGITHAIDQKHPHGTARTLAEGCEMQTNNSHLDLVTTYFNANARDWHDYYHTVRTVNDLVLIDRTDIAVGFVQNYLNPASRILDAGCGAGIASLHLLERGFVVHGIDLAEQMLALCTQNFSRKGIDPSRYTLTLGNILESDLPANSFDGIVALGFLQYQTDEDRALAALSALLKPGGILVLSGPVGIRISNIFGVPDAIRARMGLQKPGSKSKDPNIQLLLRVSVNTYSRSRLQKLLERAGLTLIDHKGHGYVHFKIIGRWLNFKRELFLHRTLTQLARLLPIDRFANDIVVVARKPPRPV